MRNLFIDNILEFSSISLVLSLPDRRQKWRDKHNITIERMCVYVFFCARWKCCKRLWLTYTSSYGNEYRINGITLLSLLRCTRLNEESKKKKKHTRFYFCLFIVFQEHFFVKSLVWILKMLAERLFMMENFHISFNDKKNTQTQISFIGKKTEPHILTMEYP